MSDRDATGAMYIRIQRDASTVRAATIRIENIFLKGRAFRGFVIRLCPLNF